MTRGQWLLPTVVDPARICLQIEIPNDANHIRAFWGALNELARAWNWEWDGNFTGRDVAYVWNEIIQQASINFYNGVECDMALDCAEVNACLPEAQNFIDLQEAVNDVVTDIDTIKQGGEDGNVYPDTFPDFNNDPDPACGASHYVIAELRKFIDDVEQIPTTTANPFEAIGQLILQPTPILVEGLINILISLFDPAPPTSVLPDFDLQQADMREYIYCNLFDKPSFAQYLRDEITRGGEIADFVDSVAFVAWERWVAIGSADDSQDCTSFNCVDCRDNFALGAQGWEPRTAGGHPNAILDNGSWRANVGEPTLNHLLRIKTDKYAGQVITSIRVDANQVMQGNRKLFAVNIWDGDPDNGGSNIWQFSEEPSNASFWDVSVPSVLAQWIQVTMSEDLQQNHDPRILWVEVNC